MANHGYATTRKKMTPEAVSALLNKLNLERFNGVLEIVYSEEVKDGVIPIWEIRCEQGHRLLWLNTPNKFEMRHGGGSNFIWWIDHVIINEIALEFNGTISDDGIEDKWKGEKEKFSTYRQYVEHMWRYSPLPKSVIKQFIDADLKQVPEKFRT